MGARGGLPPLRRQAVSLHELGVGGYGHGLGGESLLMWAAYFSRGRIYGIDIEDKSALSRGRIKVFQCSQTDRQRLTALCDEIGPFDLVIDDGSHVNPHQIATRIGARGPAEAQVRRLGNLRKRLPNRRSRESGNPFF